MNSYRDEILSRALSVIESADLAAFEQSRLKCFLINSVDKILASEFLLDTAKGDKNEIENSLEKNFRSLIKDLHLLGEKFSRDALDVSPELISALKERQNGVCHVSGKSDALEATYIIPPSILDDEELRPGGSLRHTLEASISPQMVDKMFSFLESCRDNQQERLKNLWLMSPSVSSAFRGGIISFFKNQYSETQADWKIKRTLPGRFVVAGFPVNCKFSIQPSTPDAARLPLPEGFLHAIHRPISAFNYYMSIEQEIQRGWPSHGREPKILGKFWQRLLRGLFLMIPQFLKLKLVQLMLKAVNRWRPQAHPCFKCLPWGLCLKFGKRVHKNEANALLLVEKMTTIPAPRLIGFIKDEDKSTGYLIMTVVPGIPAESVYYRMTYEERNQLSKDLGKYISQYRQIPNPHREYLICDTLGGPITDHRTDIDELCGPYRTEHEFTDFLTEGLEDQRDKYPIRNLYEKHHEICFTHSDLNLSNILLQGGKLSGLIDWENAGFKPEYWEYTRAAWACLGNVRAEAELDYAFDKNYHDELEAEKLLWMEKPVY